MRHTTVRAALLAALAAGPAVAAPVKVAVADFDYQDSSGEMLDQGAAHEARLKALKAVVIGAVTASGGDMAAPLSCGQAKCAAGDLDQDAIAKAARAENAQFVVFGGVHKVSTLIQWAQIDIMNVATGKAVLSRTVTFRGDDEAAWHHAAAYVGEMVVAAIH
jgi:hypothetical protein